MGPHTARRRTCIGMFGLAGALAVGGVFGLVSTASADDGCEQSGLTMTCFYDDPETARTLTVPAGVTHASFVVKGGSGGSGAGPGGNGAAGGETHATDIPLPPGPLGIFVGGPGLAGEGCAVGDSGGAGGHSGGPAYPTGGDGGRADVLGPANPDDPDFNGCAGGGGGGGSFVMTGGKTPADIVFLEDDEEDPIVTGLAPSGDRNFVRTNRTADPINNGPTPLVAAGGGGGGGGGEPDLDTDQAGAGGGTETGPADGGRTLVAAGDDGPEAQYANSAIYHAGGGGGGGFPGGVAGGVSGNVGGGPGHGGRGGEGYPQDYVLPAVTPASSLAVSAPTGGDAVARATADGTAGSITITFTVPPTPSPSVSPAPSPSITPGPTPGPTPAPDPVVLATCEPSVEICFARPPAGQRTVFQVVGLGGDDRATLFARLNGGRPPRCRTVDGFLSPDWVQFGFTNAKAGQTWSKRIRATETKAITPRRKARKVMQQTEICFAAPYRFVVKQGTKLVRPAGSTNWEGLLTGCRSDRIKLARKVRPNLARPCVIARSLTKVDDGWAVRVVYRVPKGELDPQGRSLRKKKKKRR